VKRLSELEIKQILPSIVLLFFSMFSMPIHAKTVHYDLTITKGDVNLSGKKSVDFALMVNGSIPAPTLEFTEGDDAEIVVKNALANEEVSLHWHGILLPPEMDGVAYVNTPPIHPGQSHTFRFKIRQHGTYWYHSHTMLQEQKGVYGAFIIRPKKETINVDKDLVAVLSDWTDENPDQVIRNLRKDGDYYLYKKGTQRSWFGAIQAGHLKTFLENEWTRMGGMDLSDVGYDAFLINGKRNSQLFEGKPGQKIRLRIINAGASSYFYVSLGQSQMEIVSADGVDIAPVLAKEVLLGMAETVDVVFEIPKNKNLELRATAQDVTGFASAWIGNGEKVLAPDKAIPDLYAPMDHSAHANHSGHKGEHAKMVMPVETLTVDDISAKEETNFPDKTPRYDLKLVLGGDMSRYVWHINGKAIHQDRTLTINEGEVVRFTLENETMMHHPMHLHGHFFRVLNRFEESSPLKHTVDVPPHATRTIEFLANEPGEWMLHCHNLYHMKSGMARVVKYSSFTPKSEIASHQNHDPHLHDHIYYAGDITAATNLLGAKFKLLKTWDELEASFDAKKDEDWKADGDLIYRRWLSQFFNIAAGGTSHHDEQRAMAGAGFTFPMLIHTSLYVDSRRTLRLDIEKDFQWTKFISSGIGVKIREHTDVELDASLVYGESWNWKFGFVFTEKSIGLGLEHHF
jgi:FtsP/CotA-like multicopper oxidase with cupredoxin domain